MGRTSSAIRNAGAMDDAAVCIVAARPMAKCKALVKDKLCAIFCCCNANPIIKGKKRKGYKQICADAMLRACKAEDAGVLGSVPYDMGETPPKPISRPNYRARTAFVYQYKDRDVELIPSERIPLKGKVRIPDIVVVKDRTRLPTQNNIAQIYDFKFPGDRWRENQKEDYQKIQGKEYPKVEALDEENCMCSGRNDDKSDSIDPQAMVQAKVELNKALEDIFADLNGKCTYNGHFDLLDMGAVREELERQARYNTTPSWFHCLYGFAVASAATVVLGAAISGGATPMMTRLAPLASQKATTVPSGLTSATVTRLAPLAGQEATAVSSELPKAAGLVLAPWFTSNMTTP